MHPARSGQSTSEWIAFLDSLIRSDLPKIAEGCGLTILRAGKSPKALCPFHEDHDPSLRFHVSATSGRQFYKCFACQAHGDAIDLVKKLRNCEFNEAVAQIASFLGITAPWPRGARGRAMPSAQLGMETALRCYSAMTRAERSALSEWAESRRMAIQVLHEAEVFLARGNKLVRQFGEDRAARDALEAAGLILRAPGYAGKGTTPTLPIEMPPRDMFSNDRVVFSLRDQESRLVGFAGRAVNPNEKAKYLFSKHLPKASLLYRLSAVAQRVLGAEKQATPETHLFIVEGLMDALRVESHGLHAVAALGCELTPAQLNCLGEFARRAEGRGTQLRVHLFFDADDAGRRGAVSALPRLLLQAAGPAPFTVDVIIPPADGRDVSKRDPDDLLADVPQGEAFHLLQSWSVPPATAILARSLRCAPADVGQCWKQVGAGERLAALRDVERRLDPDQWDTVLSTMSDGIFATGFVASPDIAGTSWQARLMSFLRRGHEEAQPGRPVRHPPTPVTPRDRATILSAIQIAQASTQRREIPVDDLSWERLLQASHVSARFLIERLGKTPDRLLEPLTAARIPKASGEYRLKALPCPEDLAVQQDQRRGAVGIPYRVSRRWAGLWCWEPYRACSHRG